jgi:hypothetical protein
MIAETSISTERTITYLRHPVIHHRWNIMSFKDSLSAIEKQSGIDAYTGCLADSLPQVARDGIRVQVLLEVQ